MPPRRPVIPTALTLTFVGLFVAIAAYVFGLAWWQSSTHPLYQANDLFVPRLIDVVVFLWAMWVGSSIGSFLNVVAWRLPNADSLRGRSHCPRCRARLKARDNFPVFGWIALKGRCRICRLPISPRYPIVEATVGLTITAVAIAQLYRLALPYQRSFLHGGPLWAPILDHTMLLTLLYHVVSLSFSWACGLIRFDGNRLPTRLSLLAIISVALPMLAYPVLMIVPWQTTTPPAWPPTETTLGMSDYLDVLMRVLTALVTAVVLTRILSHGLCPTADPKLDPLGQGTTRLIDLAVIVSIPSIVVGWQSAPAMVLIAVLLSSAFRLVFPKSRDSMCRFAIAMPLAFTFQLVFWRPLHQSAYWPSAECSPWVLMGYVAAILLATLWLRERNTHLGDTQGALDSSPAEAASCETENEVGVRDEEDDSKLAEDA